MIEDTHMMISQTFCDAAIEVILFCFYLHAINVSALGHSVLP